MVSQLTISIQNTMINIINIKLSEEAKNYITRTLLKPEKNSFFIKKLFWSVSYQRFASKPKRILD